MARTSDNHTDLPSAPSASTVPPSHPSAPRYAAIYVRVSTEDQGKGFSIPTQVEACQTLAKREGHSVPESYVLIDEGISGTTMERPGLRKLRALVTTHAIAAIVVYDPDRLSRNLGHQLLLAEELERAGVTLLIVSYPLEHGPEGWLFFQMRGALAEYERAKILERMQRGLIGRARAGNPGGGQVPLGYRAVREPHRARWEVDPEEADVVRRIFAMCKQGMSCRAIAWQFSREQVPTRHDRRPENGGHKVRPAGTWAPSTIYKILTYEGYIGTAYYGKRQPVARTVQQSRAQDEWIAIPVPPIIDDATFHAAQAQLSRNKRLARRNRRHEYLLAGGRFRCGRCGRTMSGFTAPITRRYRCTSVCTLPPHERCRVSIKADEVERRVWAAVERLLQQPEIIAAEVARQQATAGQRLAEVQQELSLIDAALAKCNREERRWADAYAAEVISLEELKGFRAGIAATRQGLHAERAQRQAHMDALQTAGAKVEALVAYCERVRQRLETFDMAEKQLALEALELRVTWAPDQPLALQGTIPLDEIVSIPSQRV